MKDKMMKYIEGINEKPKFWIPLLINLGLLMLVFFVQKDLLEFEIIKTLEETGLEYVSEDIQAALYASFLTIFLMVFGTPFIKAMFTHGLLKSREGNFKFKKTYTIIISSYIFVAIGELVKALIRVRLDDFSFNFTLSNVFTSLPTKVLSLLGYFDLFVLLYLIVSIYGLKMLYNTSYKFAAMVAVVPFGIYVIMTYLPIALG